jgi:hypothetical protein
LDGSLICGSCVLQPEGHSRIGIYSKQGDERHLDLIFFFKGNLMVARVAIKEEEQDAAGFGVNDLVDAWKCEGILRAVPIEIGVIHTHPPFIDILFQDKCRVSQPLWLKNFFDETSCE